MDRTERILIGSLIGVAVAGGILLRFLPMTPLWLDEAQSAAIASEGFRGIFEALRHDGHPPFYYLLLAVWMAVFGESGISLRALSGVLGVISIPLTWLLAKRYLNGWGPFFAAAVVAVSPFAIRYGSEVRMYALLIVVLLLAHIAFISCWERPTSLRIAAVSVVTAVLLFTHYWSLYLVMVIIVGLITLRYRKTGREKVVAGKILIGIALGGIPFVIWIPVFLTQLAHTGTPWASASRPTVVMALALESFGGGRGSEALLVAVVLSILFVWGLGIRVEDSIPRVALTELTWLRTVVVVGFATMLCGVGVGYFFDLAFQGRYAVFCFVPIVLALAVGLQRIPRSVAPFVLIIFIFLSGVSVARELTRDRTQVGAIAEVIYREGMKGDTVVFCPDQLAPAGYRLLAEDFSTIAYPSFRSGQRVDWYDYAIRNAAASPVAFADQLVVDLPEVTNVWLVWMDGYKTFGEQCGMLRGEMTRHLGRGLKRVNADGDEYYNPANLMKFVGPNK